ncbi:MAG: VPA1269 family protein [Burkholderiales bacterium]
MTYHYLSDEVPESFVSYGAIDTPVLLNPNKLKFLLIQKPSLDELAVAIENYALKRLEDRWVELQATFHPGKAIKALQWRHPKMRAIPVEIFEQILGVVGHKPTRRRLGSLSVDDQRALVAPFKPRNIAEMLAIFKDAGGIDQTGYRYLKHELGESSSSLEFFGRLTATLFSGFAQTDYKLGSPKLAFHQPRIFEFLGMSVARGWLLFPFITGESETNDACALMHRDNSRRYLNPTFGPAETREILNTISQLSKRKSGGGGETKYAKYLKVFSTFRDVSQASTAFFSRCLELVDNGTDNAHRQVGYARRSYNAILMLHNSLHPTAPNQPQLTLKRRAVSMDEFVSLKTSVAGHDHLLAWGNALSDFIRSSTNAPGRVVLRRSICVEFIEFLREQPAPPRKPELASRPLINDYTEQSQCYRNFLRKRFDRPESRNTRLQEMGQFFDFVSDRLRSQHTGDPRHSPWFANPVDLKFDRFSVEYRAGTSRKSISANIMEELRQTLIADDYAWAKQWDTDWAYLVNQDTKTLEHVWCPSAAICLYTLLSLPLRSIQARMLDSGEGDPFVYDFDTGSMIHNADQLPVNGRIALDRRAGFIQVMPSGLIAEPELVGLWISVNKTSDEGYAIPWVSDDLLCHLRYQRTWISRFAPNPSMHNIEDAQGHRNTPNDLIDSQKRFYCLFRDPAVTDRVHDKSLPVSKQKLLRLWGRLCLQNKKLIHDRAGSELHRIRLVKPGTENDAYPSALNDLHSLRVSGITDLLDRGVPLNIVCEYVAGHATYMMTLWYDAPAPGAVRRAMMQAQQRAGERLGPLPRPSEEELEELKPFLLSHPDFQGLYTGFDALKDNVGLIQVQQSGICPGTRCEEGGLSDKGRIEPVPVGDRGPSCPQCRFWLTGPAFLLGQVIEGNNLIMKVRSKVASLADSRKRIMDAEDSDDVGLADLLRARNDVEERQLNNMLTEWWHRMRFYESSINKLDDYRHAVGAKKAPNGTAPITLFKHSQAGEANFGYASATELELKHFLSTCAEILPSFADEALSAHQDIELAVGKFLAINDERELALLFFKLDDLQRLTAANLTVELLQRATGSPLDAAALLGGKAQIQSFPNLQADLKSLLCFEPQQPVLQTKRRLSGRRKE